ncbi:MAG TPA: DUF559 domain-containing protein [Dehalococcoidia bacterium]|nr:DUF559 domain-containing protein [Dehalococcoidia bacterium]
MDGAKFRRQHQIGGYIADICCHSVALVVKIDRGIHNEANHTEDGIVR